MKNWVKYKLNEVCKIGDGNHSSNYPKSNEMVSEGIPFIRANNMLNGEVVWNDMKFITPQKHQILKKGHLKAGDILFTNRGEIGKIAIVGSDFENANLNSQIAWFRCLEKINNRFLFYFLASPSMKRYYSVEKNGAALQQFTIRQINEIEIPLPPLPEQQRIVSILDEAFAAIAKAKANAEQNLKNAKELFESYLQGVFENGDWESKKWKEVLEIRSGRNQKEVEDPEGQYPILGSAGKIMGYANNFICEEGTTIVGRKGTIDNPMYIEEKFWNVDTAFGLHALNQLDKRFLFYFCRSYDFTKQDKGSGRPSLVKSDLLQIKMPIPPIEEQQTIVRQLDALRAETQKLEALYQKKINDLEELKKSILQKAFSGQLSESRIMAD